MAGVLFSGRLGRERDNQNSESECESFHRMTSLRLDIRNARDLGPIPLSKRIWMGRGQVSLAGKVPVSWVTL